MVNITNYLLKVQDYNNGISPPKNDQNLLLQTISNLRSSNLDSKKQDELTLPSKDFKKKIKFSSEQSLKKKPKEHIPEFNLESVIDHWDELLCLESKKTKIEILPPIEDSEFDSHLMTKYLTAEQRKKINKQYISNEDINQYIKKLESADGIKSITYDLFHYKENSIIALRAWHQKKISEEQFATQCMLYAAIDQMFLHPSRFDIKKTGNYTNYQRIDLQPTNFFDMEIFSICGTEKEKKYLSSFLSLVDDRIGLFSTKIEKECPFSERYFWGCELPLGPDFYWSPLHYRIHEIVHFFESVNIDSNKISDTSDTFDPKYLIIPSYTIMKLFFSETFPDSKMKIAPILGELSKETIIALKKEGIRPINIGVFGADVPEYADTYFAGKYILTLHDFYHAVRDFYTPHRYYLAIQRISSILEGLMEKALLVEEFKAFKKLRWKLHDGEAYPFYNNKNGTFSVPSFGHLFKTFPWTETARKAVIQDMVQNAETWKNSFNIDKSDLSPPEKTLYEEILKSIQNEELAQKG
jgi:hypothetical protein